MKYVQEESDSLGGANKHRLESRWTSKKQKNAYIYQYILLKMCLLIMNLSAQVLLLVLFTQHIFKTCLGKNWFFNELFVTKISLANFSLSKY